MPCVDVGSGNDDVDEGSGVPIAHYAAAAADKKEKDVAPGTTPRPLALSKNCLS